jgi:hypothetical protein
MPAKPPVGLCRHAVASHRRHSSAIARKTVDRFREAPRRREAASRLAPPSRHGRRPPNRVHRPLLDDTLARQFQSNALDTDDLGPEARQLARQRQRRFHVSLMSVEESAFIDSQPSRDRGQTRARQTPPHVGQSLVRIGAASRAVGQSHFCYAPPHVDHRKLDRPAANRAALVNIPSPHHPHQVSDIDWNLESASSREYDGLPPNDRGPSSACRKFEIAARTLARSSGSGRD